MFQSNRSKTNVTEQVIDIAPLIDIVFILLIFFMVTSTFVQDTGIEVERPKAQKASILQPLSMRISIAPSGTIYTQGRSISLDRLKLQVQKHIQVDQRRSVIVIPDQSVSAGRLIKVMDIARLAGANQVTVATKNQ